MLLPGGLGSGHAAWAGGIIQLLNPSFGDGFENRYQHATAHGAVTGSGSTASGNQIAALVTSPFNHCGGTEGGGGYSVLEGSFTGNQEGRPQTDEQDEAT
ncbi:hypothetical protein GCM10027168_70850 [Streptomyces capparidis]